MCLQRPGRPQRNMRISNTCKLKATACVQGMATLRNRKTVDDTSQDSAESNAVPWKKGESGQLTSTVKRAIWRHDVFNLFALGILNSMNFWYLYYREGARPFRQGCQRSFLSGDAYSGASCPSSCIPCLIQILSSLKCEYCSHAD